MLMYFSRDRILLACALGVVGGTLLWAAAPFFNARSVEAAARTVVEECRAQGGDTGKCYEDTVPGLYPEYSIPEMFEIIREIRRADRTYQFCHVLSHKLGEIAVAEDPERWIDVMPLNPSDGLCSNGFVHGVIVGRFRNDVLDDERLRSVIPDFARACEPREAWRATPLDQAICYHGLGHLYMFITNADYQRSLATCEATAASPTGDFMRVCREGVFMQTYQPLEPDDFLLIELLPEKPTRENYRRICAKFSNDAEEGACLREAWPLFRKEIIEEGGAAAFCSNHPNDVEEDACYDSVFAIVGRQTLAQPDNAEKTCTLVPAEERENCFSSVAGSILEEDRMDGARAIAFCARAGELESSCVRTLAERARFIFGSSPQLAVFCRMLPQNVQNRCS